MKASGPDTRSPRPWKIDIEPLGEARWARVERAVLQAAAEADARVDAAPAGAADRRRFAAAFLVLAGALAAIAGGVAWRAFLPEAHEGATRVETAAIGSRVEFGESTIDVGPSSAVRLSGDDARGVLVTLDRGRVECDVTPRRQRPPFLVEAGGVEVRVIGTHFVVTRAGDAITVDVQRGEVQVTSDGQDAFVVAGSHWPRAATPDAKTAPAEAPAPSAPADAPDPRSAPEPRPSPAPPAPQSRPAAPAPSPREQYATASRLEAQQPGAALALYGQLASQGGPWGENALFAAGRLEADRGANDDARRLLREYLSRYPSGPNAADARKLLDRLR